VRLIGLGLDEDKADLIKHIDEKKWLEFEHYHSTEEAAKIYGLDYLPYLVIVDPNGTIKFLSSRWIRESLEEDIDWMLGGGNLAAEIYYDPPDVCDRLE
jgi:hypothetical protein